LFLNIRNGITGSKMPAFARLETAQVWQIVTYLRSLAGAGARIEEKLSGDPARGQELFYGKAACASCHDGSRNQAVTKDCTSCHADHHASPTATCSTCHAQARTGHDRSAHDGCAACHVKNSDALEPRRNLCLTCHVRQADHQPGGDCAACHQVGWTRALARGAP